MEKVIIEPTRTTPLINFDPDEGILEMKGRSSPENARDFYNPVFEAMDKIASSSLEEITFNFEFEYFNTSSSKCLFRILKAANDIHQSGKTVHVNWRFDEDDEDMQESGEDLESLLDIEFNYVENQF